MQRVYTTLITLLLVAFVSANSITEMDFSWDEETPTAFTAADGDWNSALEEAIKTSASTPTEAGEYTLNIRTKDANGVWSAVRSFPVHVESSGSFNIKTALAKIASMEYYWDDESATAFTAADGDWSSALEDAINSSASTPTDPGAHTLNVRSQNLVTGVWSAVRSFPVYIEGTETFNIKTALAKIASMEYYWDEGSATAFTAADGDWSSALEDAINSSASTPTESGAHTLNVRSQNLVTGVWSDVRSFPVYIEGSATFDIKTALAKIASMEFYWDEGSATAFTAADGDWGSALEDAINSSASTPTEPGAHTLNIRSQNMVTGLWSEVRSFPVYVESSETFNIKTALAKIASMEYFWDEGSATAFSAVDGNWASALERAIASDASTPTDPGAHTLNVRSQNLITGVWSGVRSFPVYIESSATFAIKTALAKVSTMEYSWDDGAAVAFTSADGNWGSALEAALASSASTPTTPGAHTLKLRSQNMVTGTWSDVRSFPIYVESAASFDIKTALAKVSKMQYFWDEEDAIEFSAADGNWASALEQAIASNASTPSTPGAHTLNVQSQNVVTGVWSEVRSISVYVENSATFDIKTAMAKVSKMQFFWDEETPIEFAAADGNWSSALELAMKVGASTPTEPGAHTLNVQSQDFVTGEWSAVRTFPIYVEEKETFDIKTALAAVSQMEYYWNSDAPTSFTAEDGNWASALEGAIKSGASTPTTPGAHALNVRSQNFVTGVWSAVRSISVFVEDSETFDITTAIGSIASMEYYWDSETPTAFTAADGDWSSALEKAIKESASSPTTPGAHTLNVKAQNFVTGDWSDVRSFPIFVEESETFEINLPTLKVVQFEHFLGDDPGVGKATKATNLVFTQGVNRADVAVTVDTDHLVRGENLGGYRVQDHSGEWSVTRMFTLFVEADSPPYAPVITGDDSVCYSTAADHDYKIDPEYEATYEWIPVGGVVNSFNDSIANIDWDTLASGHKLKVVGTNSYGAGDTTIFDVFVEAPPTITVTANGNDLSVQHDDRWFYQWNRQGVDIEGANQSRYWVEEDGIYRVYVTNQCGDLFESNRVIVTYDPDQKKDQSAQTITFDALANVTYGDAAFTLEATATSGLAVSFESSDETIAKVVGNSVEILKAGTVQITATQEGNAYYLPAGAVVRDLLIQPKELSHSAVILVDKVYDATAVATVSGGDLIGVETGDDVSVVVTGSYADATVGTNKEVTPVLTLEGDDKDNYTVIQPDKQSAAITPAALTITANSLSKRVGAADPVLTVSYAGFVSGETEALVSGLSVTREAGEEVGTYVITPAGATAANYAITYKTGVLTISNSTPTLTSVDAQTIYEDTSLEVTLAMTDATDDDGDALTLIIGSGANYSVSGTAITPKANFNGSLSVPVSVTDGDLTSDVVNMTVTVAAVNDKPTLTTATAQSIDEDASLEVLLSMTNAADVDGDALTLTIGTGANYTVSGTTITPTANFNGTLNVPVSVSDANETVGPVTMSVTVNAVNDAPTLTTANAQTIDEDTSLELLLTMTDASDVDGDALTLVVGAGDNYTVSGTTVTPTANFNGTLSVPVSVTDGDKTAGPVTMSVTVNAVNDAPTLTAANAQSIDEDTSLEVLLTMTDASDVDGDALTLVVGAGANYTVSGTTVTPTANFNGVLSVPVSVTDGDKTAGPVTMSVTVNAMNDAPTLTAASAQAIDEDTSLEVLLTMTDASDVDGDALTLVVGAGANYTVSGTTVTPTANFNGTLSVPVSVTDGDKTTGPVTMSVTVNAVNDAPTLTAANAQAIDEDTSLEVLLTMTDASDVDGDALTLVIGTGANYTVSGTTVTPTANFNGVLSVPVSVTDGDKTTGPVTMSVTVNAMNDAPTLTTASAQAIDEDTSLEVLLTMTDASDVDGDALTLVVGAGANYTVSGTAITPTANFNGVLSVPVSVTDGSETAGPVTMSVTVNAVNDAPLLSTVTAQTIAEDASYEVTLAITDATDAEGDALTVIVGAGANYTVSGTTITPTANFNGVLSVPVSVTDGDKTAGPVTMSVTVTPVNDAPVMTVATATSVAEDASVALTLAMTDAVDVDGDALTLVVAAGANYTVTGTTVTPTANFVGTLTVPVSVTDGLLSSSVVNMTVTVTSVNDAPVLSAVTPQTTAEDVALEVLLSMVNGSDIDGDALNVIIGAGANYTVSGITVTPAANFHGTLTLPVQLTDGVLSSNVMNMVVTVTPVNDAPVLSDVLDTIIAKNTPLELALNRVTASDVDGDALTLVVGAGDDYTVHGMTVTPALDFVGDLYVPITVTDGALNSETVEMMVTVKPTTEIEVIDAVDSLDAFIAYPNPISEGDVYFSLPKKLTGEATVTIYDAMGNLIDEQSLTIKRKNSIRWDLTNRQGVPVGSGSYVAVLRVETRRGDVKLFETIVGVQR